MESHFYSSMVVTPSKQQLHIDSSLVPSQLSSCRTCKTKMSSLRNSTPPPPKKKTKKSPLYLHLQQITAGATININGEAAKRRSPKTAKNPKTCHRTKKTAIKYLYLVSYVSIPEPCAR